MFNSLEMNIYIVEMALEWQMTIIQWPKASKFYSNGSACFVRHSMLHVYHPPETRQLGLPISKTPLNFTAILTATQMEKAACLCNCLQNLDLLIGKWQDPF